MIPFQLLNLIETPTITQKKNNYPSISSQINSASLLANSSQAFSHFASQNPLLNFLSFYITEKTSSNQRREQKGRRSFTELWISLVTGDLCSYKPKRQTKKIISTAISIDFGLDRLTFGAHQLDVLARITATQRNVAQTAGTKDQTPNYSHHSHFLSWNVSSPFSTSRARSRISIVVVVVTSSDNDSLLLLRRRGRGSVHRRRGSIHGRGHHRRSHHHGSNRGHWDHGAHRHNWVHRNHHRRIHLSFIILIKFRLMNFLFNFKFYLMSVIKKLSQSKFEKKTVSRKPEPFNSL